MRSNGMKMVLAGLLLSGGAFAKITIFSNADAINHVLGSAELAKEKEMNKPLNGLDVTSIQVKNEGGQGIGSKFDLSLQYSNVHGALPTTCSFTAKVESEKTSGSGIVGSQLTAPKLSKIDCAQE